MRLTEVHARYWARRHAPGWAQTMAQRAAPHRDVLACVNAHAGLDRPRAVDTSNLVSLLQLVRKNQARGLNPEYPTLPAYLSMLTISGHGEKRRTIARRFLRRWYRATHGIRI